MKRTIKYLALVFAAISVAGCGKNCICADEGSIRIGVNIDGTRAALSSEELLSTAMVDIYYADFSGLVRRYRYSEAPEAIYLPANEYRVDITAGEAAGETPAMASWEQKSYAGSKNFTIQSGKSTNVEVTAYVSNAITKVTFDQSVADNFASGYEMSIGIEGNNLTYSSARNGAEGYFIIDGMDEPEFAWTFTGKLAKDGSDFTKSGKITGIEAGNLYGMTLKYSVKDGMAVVNLLVDYTTSVITDNIIFEPVSTGLSASSYRDIWAAHAMVYADVDESEYSDPAKISFAYSSDGSTWKTASATRASEGSYYATLTGLTPDTEYEYKLMIAGAEVGDAMSFTTDKAPSVPNGNFESTSNSFDGKYKEWYDPKSADPLCREAWWGSGNGSSEGEGIAGSASYEIICAPDTGEKVEGNQSACLQSKYAVVKFAAGNLFTGYFGGLVGTKGGMVNFGRPFTARPTGLKFYAKYSGGKITDINGAPSGITITKNDYDCGRVQIALGIWDKKTYGGTKDCPIQVNTTDTGTFIDYTKDPKTIAYGEVEYQSSANDGLNEWKEYYIPLNYNDVDTAPTHIVISCASSKYGDYFTGCRTSKLWIDKMEFIYE